MAENINNQGSKRVPVTLDDEVPMSDQSEKEVKVEEHEDTPLPTVAELQEQVAKLKNQKEKLIKIAGEHLHRAESLEKILEKKPEFLKEWTKEKEELEKQLSELKDELVKERRMASEEKERVTELTKELDEERRRTDTQKSLLVISERKKEAMEKKVIEQRNELIELAEEMEEDRKMASDERKRLLDESEKEKEELRRRLMEMEKMMKQPTQRLDGEVTEDRREKEKAVFDPIFDDEPDDGDENGRELREEGGEEQMERMEMAEFVEDPSFDNSLGVNGFDGMNDDLIENGAEEDATVDNLDIQTANSDDEEVETIRRSSRNVSRSVQYADSMEESDEEDEPSKKKKRTESVEKKEKVVHQKVGSLGNDDASNCVKVKNELECPECEFRSRSIGSWEEHLRKKHSTTPSLAGCLLRCDCGNDSYSAKHSRKCEISNFTIIRTGDKTIRRLTDPVATPQCVLCKASC